MSDASWKIWCNESVCYTLYYVGALIVSNCTMNYNWLLPDFLSTLRINFYKQDKLHTSFLLAKGNEYTNSIKLNIYLRAMTKTIRDISDIRHLPIIMPCAPR